MVLHFAYKSALELTELIRTRRASPVEIVTESLARIDSLEPQLRDRRIQSRRHHQAVNERTLNAK